MTPLDQLESHRPTLTGHCYRMLGSAVDADDAVQETMLRAIRGLPRFDGRAALGTWLYRIATNVCLDMLADRPPRVRAMDLRPAGTVDDQLTELPASAWIEPIPDARVIALDADPETRLLQREHIRLAFVAALQHLPPRQRAALLLTQVLQWSAAETAEALDMTVAAVNSALQRARATLAARDRIPAERDLTAEQRRLVARYVDCFERYDVTALTALLKEDATMSMPPYDLWLRGPAAIGAWLGGRGIGCRGSRLVPTAACGLPAFAQYRAGGAEPWSLVVLQLEGNAIADMTYFLDTAALFPRFGLPMHLAARASDPTMTTDEFRLRPASNRMETMT